MAKRVIITERQVEMLKQYIVEQLQLENLVGQIKSDLDRHYEPMVGIMREGGEYFEKPMIKVKVDEEVITPKALFEYLQYKYKLGDNFLKQVISDWVFGRIVDNRLSKNVALD